ncbi:MAG: cation-translocating P-type ATPase [Coriobacteriales bacterium]|nr:cation-translocating P-type ATPase [Coriobacteriales bacterium]
MPDSTIKYIFPSGEQPTGLTSSEVKALQQIYGPNELIPEKQISFLRKLISIIAEPMFLLLIVAATIYFILGEPRDGAIMLAFVVGIIGISVVQEWKTDKTLKALKDLSEPRVSVIRDSRETQIASIGLVPGDLMLAREGERVAADGEIVWCSDLCVDESSLTGEAEGVWKVAVEATDEAATADGYWRRDYCYAGTLVIQGSALIQIRQTGQATEYGKIGSSIAEAPTIKTPLQKQIGGIVKFCAGLAAVLFALVSTVTWFNIPDQLPQDRLIESILSGITLAMAMIPEEFPVILTIFLSMGAWRLANKQSLIRRLPSVETLGAVSVLCVDKTGTITLNQMTVQDVWLAGAVEAGDSSVDDVAAGSSTHGLLHMIETMGLACEPDTYDPMEKAMLAHCDRLGINRAHLFSGELVHEYAFTNEAKMMGHVWLHEGEKIIAVKGSPERVFELCGMSVGELGLADCKVDELSGQGFRVIAVASMVLTDEVDIPDSLFDCQLRLEGLVGLADPPRETVKADIATCRQAGIRVVMITGDYGITASAIAESIGIPNSLNIITGDMLDELSDEELRECVRDVNVFARVIPAHKMQIVQALKDNGEIVAMTGDGINDAPALRYADIGIAMGKRGSEVSREAADLILLDDNFSTIVETVSDGRRIFDNIRKAVGYVFTIHLPIALASLLAPAMGIATDALMFLPLHVVLLELVIDPTCSIVLERQPAEYDIMQRPPRNPYERLLDTQTLVKSILLGLTIFFAAYGVYLYVLSLGLQNASVARTMGLVTIIIANLFLIQTLSSEHDSIITSISRLAKDKVMWIANIAILVALLVIVYSPLNSFLKLAPLSLVQVGVVVALAAASVLWFEVVKLVRRLQRVG